MVGEQLLESFRFLISFNLGGRTALKPPPYINQC